MSADARQKVKTTQHAINCLIACGAILAAGCNPADQPAPWAAKADRVEGPARYTTNNGADWMALERGTILPEGSVVQTGLEGRPYVDLLLGDGAGKDRGGAKLPKADRDRVRLHEDTVLGIDQRTTMAAGTGFHVQTQLDLRKGHITGRVKQLEAGSLYEIRYAKGVAGLRAPEVLYEMSWGKRPGNDESSAGCVMSLLSGDAVFVQTATNPTPTVTVISAGSTFNGLTQNLAPLSEAARKEISATVKAMY